MEHTGSVIAIIAVVLAAGGIGYYYVQSDAGWFDGPAGEDGDDGDDGDDGECGQDIKAKIFLGLVDQSLPDLWNKVEFDSESYDTNNDFNPETDNTTYFARYAGYYLICANVRIESTSDGEGYALRVDSTSDTSILHGSANTGSSSSLQISILISDVVYLGGGESISMYVWRVPGATGNIDSNTIGSYTYLTIVKLD